MAGGVKHRGGVKHGGRWRVVAAILVLLLSSTPEPVDDPVHGPVRPTSRVGPPRPAAPRIIVDARGPPPPLRGDALLLLRLTMRG